MSSCHFRTYFWETIICCFLCKSNTSAHVKNRQPRAHTHTHTPMCTEREMCQVCALIFIQVQIPRSYWLAWSHGTLLFPQAMSLVDMPVPKEKQSKFVWY